MRSQVKLTHTFVLVYFVVLAIATFAAYGNIFEQGLLRWDDNIYLNSELVKSLSWDNLLSILSSSHHSNWHPLTTISFAIEHAIWGTKAVPSKLTNIVLHFGNVILFCLLCYHLILLACANKTPAVKAAFINRILQQREQFALYSSLAAAAIFALHPQHVESVAWISERKGLLCTIFYLATLIAYIKSVTTPKRLYNNLTLIFTLCAMMSKPMAVSLPIAMILLDIYPLKGITKPIFSVNTLRTLLRGKLIYILLAFASAVITLLFQDAQSSTALGYLPRLVNATAAYLHYIASIFYPLNLSPFHPFQDFSLNLGIDSALPVLLFAGCVYISVRLFIKGIQFPLIILTFYILSLLPVIGIVKVGYQAMADRYAYLPTIGFYILLGIGLFSLSAALRQARFRFAVAFIWVLLCITLGITTYEQTKHWQSDTALWRRVIEVYPDSAAFAYINLASAHAANGDGEAARIEPLMTKAFALSPDDPYSLKFAANYYGQLGSEQKALEYLFKLVQVAPDNIWAQTQLGDIYFELNDFAQSGNYYLAAINYGSDSAELIYRLATIDYHYQRYADALAKLELLSATEIAEKARLLSLQINDAMTNSP